MKILLLLLLSVSLIWAETPAPSPEATPSGENSQSELEAKLRKQAEDLKREMDEKLKDAKTGTISLFEAAKKKIAEAIKEENAPTPTPAPVEPPPPVVAATPKPAALPPGKITSEAIAAHPDLYIGQIVSLNANIKSIESDRFIIDGDIIVPANMDALDKKETPRDRIEVKDGSLVRTTVLPQKIGRTVEEVILMPGQLIAIHGKVEEIEERIVIRGNVTKVP